MKKNKMMRLASAVLVLVLLTTCAISGTFAKYITDNDASDTARVAKFGVVIQADGVLYDTKYNDVDQDDANIPSSSEDTAVISVNSEDTDKVVAPGTESEDGLYFSLTGNPEVRTQLDATITASNIYLNVGTYGVMVSAPNVTVNSYVADKYYTEADDTYTLSTGAFDANAAYFTLENVTTLDAIYYPVVYAADVTGDITADSLNKIAADYAKRLNNGTEVTATVADGLSTYVIGPVEYPVKHDYTAMNINAETLSWEWAFENTDKDGADTILGDLIEDNLAGEVVKLQDDDTYKAPEAAAGTELKDYCTTTSFAMEISVTQLD